MIVETSGGKYSCTAAKQHLDGVHLLDPEGKIIVIIGTPADIKSVEGGEIVVVEQPETPDPDTTVWDELDAAYQEGVDSV